MEDKKKKKEDKNKRETSQKVNVLTQKYSQLMLPLFCSECVCGGGGGILNFC